MENYESYKKAFLERVFELGDCLEAFWKEKFLAGLPLSLGDLIRTGPLAESNMQTITYGSLFAACEKFLIDRCLEKRVSEKERKDFRVSQGICEQFGIEWRPERTRSHKVRKHHKSYQPEKASRYGRGNHNRGSYRRNPRPFHRKDPTYAGKERRSRSQVLSLPETRSLCERLQSGSSSETNREPDTRKSNRMWKANKGPGEGSGVPGGAKNQARRIDMIDKGTDRIGALSCVEGNNGSSMRMIWLVLV